MISMAIRASLAAVLLLVPLICQAEGRSPVDAAVKGLFSGLLLTGFVLFVSWAKRSSDKASGADKSELSRAAANGKLPKVISLIEAGADVNQQEKDSGTALMYAVRNNRGAVVEYLLTKGARTDVTTKSGKSILEIAEKFASPKVVSALHGHHG